jgi:drug/metabolite transporter (DMT)-like permease
MSFGAMAIFARFAYESGADPAAVLFLRFTIATACLATLVVARRPALPRGRNLATLLALGAVGYTLQSLSFFVALTRASVGLVALLLYLYPALVTLLAVVVLGDRLTPAKVGALALALAGSALTIGPIGSGSAVGVALALAAALIYSVYILVNSRLALRVGALASTAVISAGAASSYTVIVLATRPSFPGTAGGWAAVVAIAVVSTVVAMGTFLAGLARLGPADASTLSTLEPAVTVVLAAVVLDERVTPVQTLGGAMILAAVVVLSRVKPAASAAGEHAPRPVQKP